MSHKRTALRTVLTTIITGVVAVVVTLVLLPIFERMPDRAGANSALSR